MPNAGRDGQLPVGPALVELIGTSTVGRFLNDLSALNYRTGPIAVAVSGGPDSTALLLLTVATVPVDQISVATIDHGLRRESAREAEQVATLCATLGVAHTTIRVAVPKTRGGLQAAARRARYSALGRWCPSRPLLLAHHRDDVAESLLMRLARGSGVRGLARMPERALLAGHSTALLRPLLAWSKADLLGVCARVGIETIRDPSNTDMRYDRTRARVTLSTSPWLDPEQLSRAASNLADADEALDWLTDRLWAERAHVHEDGLWAEIVLDARDLPHEVRRRLVQGVLLILAGADPGRNVETLIAMLDAGRHAMLADVQAVPGTTWIFRRAPPRRTG